MPAAEAADVEQLGSVGNGDQGTFVAAMAAAFGQPDDVMDADSGAAAAVQPNSLDDDVDAEAAAAAGSESGLVDDLDDGLQLGDAGSPAEAAMVAAAAASAASAAAAKAAAAAAATAAQAAAAEVLLGVPGTEDAPTPAALADVGSDVAPLPLGSDMGASDPVLLEAIMVSVFFMACASSCCSWLQILITRISSVHETMLNLFAVQQDDGWRAVLPADSTAAQSDAPQSHAADSAKDGPPMGSNDITALAKQLAAAVKDVKAAAGGGSQPDAPADVSAEEDAAASAAAAAAAAAEQQLALAEAPSDEVHVSDEVHGIDTPPSQTKDDGAADAE